MKNTCKLFFGFMLLFLLLPLSAGADILINEVMAMNGTYIACEAWDWLELYNTDSKKQDLSGWGLSNDPDEPMKWLFPDGTTIKGHGYILVYCTGESHDKGKNGTYYTDFKISSKGVALTLTPDDAVEPAARLYVPTQYGCVSYGLTSGGTEPLFLDEPTPGKANTAGHLSRAAEPVLSLAGGFYEKEVTVSAVGGKGDVLHYTLDGSTPTEKSKLLPAEGITLKKTGVVRVRAFNQDKVASPVAGATYLIGEKQLVPTVCLITDEKYLFNEKTGALVKGTGSTPNYEKELEYPVHIEYFDTDGACLISQTGTFTAAGHSARQNQQRSIALYARKAYGPDRFYFDPFPHRDYGSYKSLLLRGANSDAFSTRLRDPVISSLAEGQDLIYQDALAIEVYINGRYWGHYNLREKINKHFVAQWEHVTDEKEIDQIDILARSGSDAYVQNGSNADWLELVDFCKTEDLNDPEHLRWVTDRLDVDSLFTHAAFEIIIGNGDFTNVRMYRVPGGKWKYLLFDVEAGFNNDEWNTDPIGYYIRPVKGKYQGFRHEPLNALLNVPEMRDRFLTTYARLLEECFLWDKVETHFLEWESTLEELLPRHIARWKNLTMTSWRQNVNAIKNHARRRPAVSVFLLQKAMKLTDEEVWNFFGPVLKEMAEQNFTEKELKSFFPNEPRMRKSD